MLRYLLPLALCLACRFVPTSASVPTLPVTPRPVSPHPPATDDRVRLVSILTDVAVDGSRRLLGTSVEVFTLSYRIYVPEGRSSFSFLF
jgi:hypothetical protein